MRFQIYFIFFIHLLTQYAFAKERIVFSVDLVRHGDRTPKQKMKMVVLHPL